MERREIRVLQTAAEARDLTQKRMSTEIDRLRNRLATAESKDRSASAKRANSGDLPAGNTVQSTETVDVTGFMKRDPAYAGLHRKNLLLTIRRRYGDLKALGLPPDKLSQLNELLADTINPYDDVKEAALAVGIKEGSPEFNRALNDAYNSANTAVKTFLGPSAYQELLSLESASSARANLEANLGTSLAAAGMALSNDQVSALVQTQLQNQRAPQSVSEQAYNAKAAEVLTPDQLELFTEITTTQKESTALQQRAFEAAKQQYPNAHGWSSSGP
jgi:hypothetical protein